MTERAKRSGWVAVTLAILAVLFDAATILPALAGGYTLKRSVGFDLIPHYDTLPDDVIKPGLRWLAGHAAQEFGAEP